MTYLRPGLGLASLLALLTLACGGDSEPEPLTPEGAEAVVAAGLLTENDLPSATWAVQDIAADAGDADDSGDGAEDMFTGIEACEAVQAAFEGFGEQDDLEALAEAERTFSSENAQTLMTRQVSSNVIVPHPDDDIDEGFDLLREAFAVDTIRPCFEEAFTQGMGGEGVVISSINVTEPEFVAEDGVGLLIEMDAVAVIVPIKLTMQMHFWPQGSAVGMLMMMELNSELLADESESILQAAQDRLKTAVEDN